MWWSDGKRYNVLYGRERRATLVYQANVLGGLRHREVKGWLRKGNRTGLSSVTISLGFWLLKDELGCEYQGWNLWGERNGERK